MMHWISFVMVLSWATTVPVQGRQLSIRAASAQPVEGRQRMQVEHSDRVIWVSPTSSITAGDIEKAQPEVRPDGDTVIAVVFTDAGAEKMQTLTRAQMKKLVALVVDGRVVWAPIGSGGIFKASGSHRQWAARTDTRRG